MAGYRKGDRVAWHHSYATQFAEGAVIRSEAVPQGNQKDPGAGQFGTIVGAANDAKTWWTVNLDDGGERVLTDDELVKVAK